MSKELDCLEMWNSSLTNVIYIGKVNMRSNTASSKRDITNLAISTVAEHFAKSTKYSALIRADGELRWSKKEEAFIRNAAPDMYEALEDVTYFLDELRKHGIDNWSGEKKVRAVLAKAKGGSPE